jgi:predicted glycosyltransferase
VERVEVRQAEAIRVLEQVQVAADHPERVLGIVAIGTSVPLAPLPAERTAHPFEERLTTHDGWAKYNKLVVVCGPRIDPQSLPKRDGVSYRSLVPDLYRHLAACDLAVVQGGLTTCLELTASRRPFIYVPLRHHFEQNFHVRHRLNRYGAGRHLPYEQAADPDALADAIAAEIDRNLDYRPVARDGAARAARLLADLL